MSAIEPEPGIEPLDKDSPPVLSDDAQLVIFSQVVAFCVGITFRNALHPALVSPIVRHIVQAVVGLSLVIYCYGFGVFHLIILSIMNYLTLRLSSPRVSHVIVAVQAFSYLSLLHMERMIFDYGSWKFTVTTTIMMTIQKTTSLAFALHDGRCNKDKDESTRPIEAPWNDPCYRKMPSALEFFSYVFSFHGVLLGPICFYHDYKRFIEGTVAVDPATGERVTRPTEFWSTPHPMSAVVAKFLQLLVCVFIMVVVLPKLPSDYVLEDDFIQKHGRVERFLYFIFAFNLMRFRYYFGWTLGEMVNNAAGFGYNGKDPKTGKDQWNLCENVNIRKIELATSLKVFLDHWNKLSAIWLRQIVYSRLPPSVNLVATYVVSSIWHGFYPGYYVGFLTVPVMTMASRKWRRHVRPLVQTKSNAVKMAYDVFTWATTQMSVAYFGVAFQLLSLKDVAKCYGQFYWFVHVGAFGVVLFFWVFEKLQTNAEPKEKKGV